MPWSRTLFLDTLSFFLDTLHSFLGILSSFLDRLSFFLGTLSFFLDTPSFFLDTHSSFLDSHEPSSSRIKASVAYTPPFSASCLSSFSILPSHTLILSRHTPLFPRHTFFLPGHTPSARAALKLTNCVNLRAEQLPDEGLGCLLLRILPVILL